MATRTRFTPSPPRPPLERWVLALLYAVVLLPMIGVVAMMIVGGSFFGVTLAELGEMPGWMVLWLVLGAVLSVLVAVWATSMFIDWLTERRNRA